MSTTLQVTTKIDRQLKRLKLKKVYLAVLLQQMRPLQISIKLAQLKRHQLMMTYHLKNCYSPEGKELGPVRAKISTAVLQTSNLPLLSMSRNNTRTFRITCFRILCAEYRRSYY